MTTKEDVKKLLNKYEEIEILENALLCERQLNIELQEQIEKMKDCYNCKHKQYKVGSTCFCDLEKPLNTCEEWELKND